MMTAAALSWAAGAVAALAFGFGAAAVMAGLPGVRSPLGGRPRASEPGGRPFPGYGIGVRRLGRPAAADRDGAGAASVGSGPVPPWADPLLTRAALLGRWWIDRYGPPPDEHRMLLEQSGMAEVLSRDQWTGIQLAWALVAGGFAAVTAIAALGSPAGAALIGPAAAAAGWRAAAAILRRQQAAYQQKLSAALPGVAEHLLMATAGGMNVRQALALTAATGGTELHRLLGRVVDGLGAGKGLEEAVEAVLPRVEPGPVRLVLKGLIDAERLGTKYADTLRDQTALARDLGRQELERRLNLVPVKLMMVTMFFMLPPILIVVVLPNLLTILRSNW